MGRGRLTGRHSGRREVNFWYLELRCSIGFVPVSEMLISFVVLIGTYIIRAPVLPVLCVTELRLARYP